MDRAHPRIFVAIASYCDPILPWTLDDCIEKARRPENLRFGICWQYDKRDAVDLTRFRADPRFRFSVLPYEASEGGSWARSIAQQFWDGEEYTLQVDSHMAFARGWDASLVRMMRSLPADKPLITMNAPLFSIDGDGRISKRTDLGIRTTSLAEWSQNTAWSTWFTWGLLNTQKPGRSRFISGNFVFALGSWTDEIRQDPEAYYHGEEFALTLRSYTHGYDFFLPDEIVAWHMEHRDGPPRRHWEHGKDVVTAKNHVAFERLRKLAYSDDPQDQRDLGRYGLGLQRRLRDYEWYAGMDLKNKKAHPHTYTGQNPDPVTIKSEADWDDCLTYKRYREICAT
jgi:hypothetical protein